jgi:DNA-binding protein HU-beta
MPKRCRENSNDYQCAGRRLAEAPGTNEAVAKQTITAMFHQIASVPAKVDDVSILGFGKFVVGDRPERQGRNPFTGEAITVVAAKKVLFLGPRV